MLKSDGAVGGALSTLIDMKCAIQVNSTRGRKECLECMLSVRDLGLEAFCLPQLIRRHALDKSLHAKPAKVLTEKEVRALKWRDEGLTYKVIGMILELSTPRARQLCLNANRKMGAPYIICR